MQTHPACFGLYPMIHLKSYHPQTGRGKGVRHHGFTLNIFSLCYGKCSRLLHMQMAGRREVTGSQPRA